MQNSSTNRANGHLAQWRFALGVVLLLALMLPQAAVARLTAASRVALAGKASTSDSWSRQAVSCFIEVADAATLTRLQAAGATIESRFGTLATARMPLAILPQVASTAGVRRVAVAQPLTLTNDSARAEGRVDPVHLGHDLPQAYKGRGAVLGLIDSGVDFNHINFLDAQGHNRISRVYMPHDTTGCHPVVAGDTLPGSHYTTAAQIAALTTDTPTMWHGTHTLGTAAGSYTALGYHGVAPEAELVVCAMPVLYDTDIANAIRYILAYADSVGRPAVVSMSFGSQEGAHNGTSPLCQVFDTMSGPGRLMVISAGNDARLRLHLSHRFTQPDTDTLRTYFDNYYSSSRYKGYVSAWSDGPARHRLGFTVVDRTTSRQVAATTLVELTDTLLEIAADSIAELAPYFSGQLVAAAELDPNGQYHSVAQVNVDPLDSRYRLGYQIVVDEPTMLHAWSSGVIMINDAHVPGYTAATRACSISDLATGREAISVGAYCSRATVPLADGGELAVDRSQPTDIAYFSGFGPDMRGISRPDVCAPGLALVSSASRFVDSGTPSAIAQVGAERYPYRMQSGTSMSTPFVAGAIALWLQARPGLTSGDVRQLLQLTARRDAYVEAAPERWGYGKIDVAAALALLAPQQQPGDLNADGLVDIDDLNLLINQLLGKSQPTSAADLDNSGLVDIDDVNLLINLIIRG